MAAVEASTAQSVYLQWALYYLGRGWSVVPVGAGDKVPLIKWSEYTKRLPTEDEVREWWRQHPRAHVGIVTGRVSGIFVVDEDVKDLGDETLRDLELEHGDLPETVTCLTGGGGRHLFFKHPGAAVKSAKGVLGQGVDIRGDGGFVVAHPSGHKSGRQYTWEADLGPSDIPVADAPKWLLLALESPLGDETGHVVDIQRDGLNRVQDGREHFARDMVWAAAQAFLRDGRDLTPGGLFYDVWPQYERMAKPRGGGTLEDEGRGESMVWQKCETAVAKLAGQAPQAKVTEDVPPETGGIEILDYAELASLPPPEWLIDGLLQQDVFSVIYGPPGSYKSFVAIDWALSIAHGGWWRDRPIKKAGPVVYVAGEGLGGLRKRIDAWHQHNGTEPDGVAFFTVRTPINLVDSSANHVAALIDAVRTKLAGRDPALIVIDTLARTFIGGDENSGQDMGLFIANCERIRHAFAGCHVQAVHHSGKDVARGARGHSSLKGSVDAEFEVIRDEASPIVCIKNHKQKDAEEASPMFARAEVVSMASGFGEVTSLVLVPAEERDAEMAKPLSDDHWQALDLLSRMIENGATGTINGMPAVKNSAWRKAAESELDRSFNRNYWHKWRAPLEKAGKIICAKDLVMVSPNLGVGHD